MTKKRESLTTEAVLQLAESQGEVSARLHLAGGMYLDYKITAMGDGVFGVDSSLVASAVFASRQALIAKHWAYNGKPWSIPDAGVASAVAMPAVALVAQPALA